jgi:flagellar basal body-associated protein FliL
MMDLHLASSADAFIIIIIIIIIIIMITTTTIIPLTQGNHTCVPETNHVSRAHSAAAIPHVLLMVHTALSAILNSAVLLH